MGISPGLVPGMAITWAADTRAAKGCITQHLRAGPENMAMEMPGLGHKAEVHLLTHQN